jgi:hypothetical protein
MPRYPQSSVDIPRIVAVDIAEGAAEGIFVCGYCDDMNMVGHEAIGPNLDAKPPSRIREQIEIKLIVAILEKGRIPPVSALGDMVRDTGKDDAREACHTRILTIWV